jgi:hypothetical protein
MNDPNVVTVCRILSLETTVVVMCKKFNLCRSNARVCGLSLAGIAGSNLAGGINVCLLYVSCVLSGRGLCDGPIFRPEESYRLWCV